MSLRDQLRDNAEIALGIIRRYMLGEKIDSGVLDMAKLSVQYANLKIKTEILPDGHICLDGGLADDCVDVFKNIIVELLKSENAMIVRRGKTNEYIGGGSITLGYYDDLLYIHPTTIWGCLDKIQNIPSKTKFNKILINKKIVQVATDKQCCASVKIGGKNARFYKIIDSDICSEVLKLERRFK